jgi:hypothetical protein
MAKKKVIILLTFWPRLFLTFIYLLKVTSREFISCWIYRSIKEWLHIVGAHHFLFRTRVVAVHFHTANAQVSYRPKADT